MIFDSAAQDLYDGLKPVDLILQLAAIANSKSRLLPVFVNTDTIVASAPAARRLNSVTFDLPCLA